MNGNDGHSLPSRAAAAAPGSFNATSLTDDSSHTLATRQDARRRSFLDLDDDVFNYVCSYVPVNDLLHNVAVASHETRRRVSANHALWQQLWMRYLLFFFNALIPATATAAGSASSPTAPTRGRWGVAPPDAMGMLHTTTTTPPSHDSVWHLYHFHHSAEAKPHVVQLEKLHIVREDIADPAAAASPTWRRAPSELRTAEVQAQLLSFAQACATQTVAQNLTYMTAPSSPSSASPLPSARPEGVPQGETFAHGSTLHVLKQQQRQADRLQRVLHFLLSASGHRPRFHDRLWGATNDAEKEFIRKARMGAASTDTKPAKRRNPLSPSSSYAAAAPHSSPARVRPMSWIDDQETSVKVLLFDDDTRSVGDAAAVQEERSKLLASIATNWRTAYASNFYPSVTNSSEPGSPLSRLPASNLPVSATVAATAGGGAAPPVPDAESSRREQQLNGGHVTWEQVYRRFRDGSSANIRSTARIQQQAAAQRRDAGTDDDDAAIPSSSNPLFDLHLLGYEKRKQVYAAMLASTVEVPEGMGAFFGTCVSESFLRWWCWRNRQHTEASQAPVAPPANAVGADLGGLPVRRHIALAPFTAACDDASPLRSLWVVRVAARDPRDDIGRGEAEEESVTYSSSYSDMSTTASNTSSYTLASSSIRFSEEREEENEFSTAEDSSELETAHAVAADEEPHVATAEASSPPQPPPTPSYHPPVAVLFPLPHMLTYWFMMHHVSFYSHQVYRRMWGDQELTIAVWSRILSPTGHSAECRLFYSLRCATFPRMFTKMMFTPGVLPSLTLQGKMAERSPYCSSSSSSSSAYDSQSLSADADGDAGSTPGSSSASTGDKPVDSRQIYDLFWTGFGRVEVDSGPTISRSNMLRLRIALGLPVNFPMGLLWNVVMFASGIGPLILKEHRHSLHFNYAKTFTDVVADEFGELACFGLGAQSPNRRNDSTAMANPLDAEAAMWGRPAISAMAPAVGQEHVVRTTDNNQDTPESDEQAVNELDPAHHDTSSAPTPLTGITNWSWDLDSEFSSDETYWSLPGSDVSSGYQ